MCTVSFVPVEEGVLICSNRDEKIKRSPALFPQWQWVNGKEWLFPKDPDASGTWIAMNRQGHLAVLLNGGWEKHLPVYPYRQSRGLSFLEICSEPDLLRGFQNVSLDQIEPFTLVLYKDGQLQENRWDGQSKYSRILPADQARIWSSVTLYDAELIRERTGWFDQWLKETSTPQPADLEKFHRFGGKGDLSNDLCMNRDNEMLTVSITCMGVYPDSASMSYTDLLSGKRSEQQFLLLTNPEIVS